MGGAIKALIFLNAVLILARLSISISFYTTYTWSVVHHFGIGVGSCLMLYAGILVYRKLKGKLKLKERVYDIQRNNRKAH